MSLGSWLPITDFPTPLSNTSGIEVNGKAYVIGGFNLNESGIVYEYDPVTNVYTQKSSMPTARYDNCLVSYNSKIYSIGGHTYGSPYQKFGYIEEFTPSTNLWRDYSHFPQMTPREDADAICTEDGKVYVFGGAEEGNSYSKRVEMLDLNNLASGWVQKSDMPHGRNAHGVEIIDNKAYVIGGFETGGAITNKVDIYDIATDTWVSGQEMPTPRRHAGITKLNNKILVVGGYNTSIPDNTSLKSVEIFNPKSASGLQWTSLSPIGTSTGKDRFAIATVANKVYIFAGWYGKNSSTGWFSRSAEVFTPPTHTFGTLINDYNVDLYGNKLITKDKIDTIRTMVNEFRVANGLQSMIWTDDSIEKYKTTIKTTHWNEIKLAIQDVYDVYSVEHLNADIGNDIKTPIEKKEQLRDIRTHLESIVKSIKGKI